MICYLQNVCQLKIQRHGLPYPKITSVQCQKYSQNREKVTKVSMANLKTMIKFELASTKVGI